MNSVLILNPMSRNWLVIAVFGLSFICFSTGNQTSKLCMTEDCLRSATSLLESMNKSVDPCDNFYEFSCGRYSNMHRIPKTTIITDQFTIADSAMKTLIRDYLEKKDSKTDPLSVKKARILYRSCIDLGKINAAGLEPLLTILRQIGLPTLATHHQYDSKNLSKYLARTKKIINYDYLLKTTVESHLKNRTVNLITLSKPNDAHLFPAHKMFERMNKINPRRMREASGETNDEIDLEQIEILKANAKYFEGIMYELIKAHYSNPMYDTISLEMYDYKRLMITVLEYEYELQQIKKYVPGPGHDPTFIMPIKDLQTFTDNITKNVTKSNQRIIDWKEYFTILFADVENVTLDFETDLIQLYNTQYFIPIIRLLAKSDAYANVINLWWEIVTYISPYTSNQIRFIQDTFNYVRIGLERNPSRSLQCAEAVNTMMGMAVSYVLVDMESVDRNINMLIEMMKNLQWAFEKLVTESNWMDDQTKNKTLHKAKQMKTLMAFPNFIKDPKQLDKYYENFEVIERNYLGSIINYAQQKLNDELKSLRRPHNYTINTWTSNPLDIYAYNSIQANAITIPAGLLQSSFFGHDLQVLNYGNLGSIIGHELTHGFDNTGRKFDESGNKNMWWTNRTIEEFEKRVDCFIRHYGSYSIPGIETTKVNGTFTLDENIADNGGLREALWAYRKYVAEHGEEPKLPGLQEFSNEQIYYLSYANSWCQLIKEGLIEHMFMLSDEHSPNYVRVIGGLTNSEEFSEIWKCKEGSKMNPSNKKCKIW